MRRTLTEVTEDLALANGERVIFWLPVAFAFGAGMTCSVRADDSAWVWVVATCVSLCVWIAGLAGARAIPNLRSGWIWTGAAALGLFGAAFCGGGGAGLLRAQALTAPVVADFKGARALTGYVTRVDKSQGGAWRASIALVSLSGTPPADRPRLVRISLKQDEPPLPGTAVSCRAVLRPPPGPVVPGAYDHARRAWFMQLGGVGFALEPCRRADLGNPPLTMRLALTLAQWRAQVSRALIEVAPGPGAGFLAAVTTGDRTWLSPEDTQALQVSGLSHIISVSGLHVSLLGAMVFLSVWKLLALVPALALRWDVRKFGAGAALLATAAYSVFSGAEAPAVRAAIMSAIAFGAILLDRKAISMRGLALAAIAVLTVMPESALEPGFQMSFLATAALVAMWEMWSPHVEGAGERGPLRTAFLWVAAAAGTSLVAGLATAPVSAATFHRLSPWALPANLLAAPINDFIVAPAALIGTALSPFGLGEWPWQVAGWGLSLTLRIAHWVAGLPGAGLAVPWTGSLAPIVLIVAILWLTLWRGWLRLLGLLPVAIGLLIWVVSPKPVGWISPEGKAVLATPSASAPTLCRTTGSRFDGARLMDHAGLSDAQAQTLMPISSYRAKRACFLGEGDWEARYIENGRGRAVLALTMNGKTDAFGRGDLPQGALVMRDGWRVYLQPDNPRQGPWAARPVTDDLPLQDDLNDDSGLRFGREQ